MTGYRLAARVSRAFQVGHSLVLHLSVERQGDVPLFGERPRQDVVAMTSYGGVEVRDNVVRQCDGGEKPHCVAVTSRARRWSTEAASPSTVKESSGPRPHSHRYIDRGSPDTMAAAGSSGQRSRKTSATMAFGSITTRHVVPPERTCTTSPGRSGAGSSLQSPARNRRSTSSTPSSASSSSIGVTSAWASSTSTRWMAVSCAMRRPQKPTVRSSHHQVSAYSCSSRLVSSCSNCPSAAR